MNYLDLCRELVSEFGLAGGTGPDKVANQTGELGNVVRWIRDAALDLDNRWEDWRYLWLPYIGTLPQNVSFPTPVQQAGVLVRRWQVHTLKYRSLNPLSDTWTPLGQNYVDFQRFYLNYDFDTAAPGPPGAFTVMPDNSLQFDRPADTAYQLKAGFYRLPAVLAQDTDQPYIPEQYQRIIRIRALKYYADKEDAPELVRAAISEYPDLLEKLESAQLDAFRHRGSANQVTDQAGMGSSREPSWT